MSYKIYLEKDSSDDENDLFSSDHLLEKSSDYYNNTNKKFKSGDEDYKINTGFYPNY